MTEKKLEGWAFCRIKQLKLFSALQNWEIRRQHLKPAEAGGRAARPLKSICPSRTVSCVKAETRAKRRRDEIL